MAIAKGFPVSPAPGAAKALEVPGRPGDGGARLQQVRSTPRQRSAVLSVRQDDADGVGSAELVCYTRSIADI